MKTLKVLITGNVQDASGLLEGEKTLPFNEAKRLIEFGVAKKVSKESRYSDEPNQEDSDKSDSSNTEDDKKDNTGDNE